MLQRFQASASGDITGFRVKANAKGDVKVAIYADSSNSLNAMLRTNTSKVWFDTYPV